MLKKDSCHYHERDWNFMYIKVGCFKIEGITIDNDWLYSSYHPQFYSCLNLIVNLFWGPLNIYDLPPSILYINLSLDLNSCTKKRKSLDLNFFDNVGGYSRRRPYPKKLKTWKKNCLALYHSFWADSKAILRTVIHRRIGIYRRGHKVCLENFSLWLLFLMYFHCF